MENFPGLTSSLIFQTLRKFNKAPQMFRRTLRHYGQILSFACPVDRTFSVEEYEGRVRLLGSQSEYAHPNRIHPFYNPCSWAWSHSDIETQVLLHSSRCFWFTDFASQQTHTQRQIASSNDSQIEYASIKLLCNIVSSNMMHETSPFGTTGVLTLCTLSVLLLIS